MNHFILSEFDDKSVPGSGSEMKPEFLSKLDAARGLANIPFKINSGYRTPANNKKVGGVSDSAHQKGFAADVAAPDGRTKWIIVSAAIKAGFNRIGVAKTYVHLDCDPDLPENVIWEYS